MDMPVQPAGRANAGWSPQRKARLAALVMFFEGIASVSGHLRIPGSFTVTNDAAATAARILAGESLYQAGVSLSVLAVVLHVAGLVLFYELVRPVNRTVARISAYLGLVGIAVQAASAVFQAAPLKILHGADYGSGFSAEQLEQLAYQALWLQGQTVNMYLIYFGVSIILLGWLVYRSGFVPPLLGVLEMIAGAAYLILLWPPLARAWHPWYLLLGAGELALGLWLLTRGVDSARWYAAARRDSIGRDDFAG